jgi:hypothetical protein
MIHGEPTFLQALGLQPNQIIHSEFFGAKWISFLFYILPLKIRAPTPIFSHKI